MPNIRSSTQLTNFTNTGVQGVPAHEQHRPQQVQRALQQGELADSLDAAGVFRCKGIVPRKLAAHAPGIADRGEQRDAAEPDEQQAGPVEKGVFRIGQNGGPAERRHQNQQRDKPGDDGQDQNRFQPAGQLFLFHHNHLFASIIKYVFLNVNNYLTINNKYFLLFTDFYCNAQIW